MFLLDALQLIIVSTISSKIITLTNGQRERSGDYCNDEVFNPSCLNDEVILVKKALYGRMQIGRCVRSDAGIASFLGCSSDVLHVADKWCSGRHSCEILVNHRDFQKTKPCFEELKSYLEATYTCLKIISPLKSFCSATTDVVLTSDDGILSSITTDEVGCGSVGLPWMIDAKPGQQISLTMVDFGISKPSNLSDSLSKFDAITRCITYGFIIEKSTRTNKTICGGIARETTLYVSNTHNIQVQVLNSAQRLEHQFLLRYRFTGCTDLHLQSELIYTRDGDNVTVTCKWTKQMWRLSCKDSQWIGVIGNCSKYEETAPQAISGTFFLSDNTMLIVIVGSSVIIALLLATICLVYGFRSRFSNTGAPRTVTIPTYNMHTGQFSVVPCDERTIQGRKPDYVFDSNTKGDFVHIWQRPLPEPLIPTPTLSGRAGTGSRFNDNIKTLNTDTAEDNNFQTTNPKYYVLEHPNK